MHVDEHGARWPLAGMVVEGKLGDIDIAQHQLVSVEMKDFRPIAAGPLTRGLEAIDAYLPRLSSTQWSWKERVQCRQPNPFHGCNGNFGEQTL